VQALYDANAEVILSGHQHNYQRFAPQTPDDVLDPARGLRSFVVGTGGIGALRVHRRRRQPRSERRQHLRRAQMTLKDGSYDFQFVHAAGTTFTDSGTGTCH
jgi:hypothetical protein